MPLLGLIGNPVSHSLSPSIFADFFASETQSWDYQLFPLDTILQLVPLIESHPQLRGLNVTIPYKQQVIPFLNALDPSAEITGAVNTILIQGHGQSKQLIGYNTDTIGFEKSLLEIGTFTNTKALILGTGGASKAVQYVLSQLQIPFVLISRKLAPNCLLYKDLTADIIRSHTLIINTTPLGMEPHPEGIPPLDFTVLGNEHVVYDLVYKPAETLLIKTAKAQGAGAYNGLRMLQLQAEAAWDLFKSNTA